MRCGSWARAPGPDEARVVYGMVVEMGMPKGLDLLATYADGTSRYYNFSGAGVVCDAPTPEIAKVNEMALEMCRQLMKMEITQPWTEPRRPAPGPGMCRISFLTPAGPHFAEAPVEAIAQDPNAGVFLKVATLLMKHLLELPKQPGK